MTDLIRLSLGIQYNSAKNAYEHVLEDNPNHAKVLQQLGWLYHQPGTTFSSQDLAIQYLTRSLESGTFLFFLSNFPPSSPTVLFPCTLFTTFILTLFGDVGPYPPPRC